MTEPTAASGTTPTKPAKAFSCVRCFERKVKCDKEHPCGGCVRSNVECVFRVPAPPRRKKKRTQEDILTERLNQYEQILQQKGINIQAVIPEDDKSTKSKSPSTRNGSTAAPEAGGSTASTTSKPDPRSFIIPKLIWEEGKSRFTDNNLWTRVAEEMRTTEGALHESSSDEDEENELREPDDSIEFTLGITPGSSSARSLHPGPSQIMALWQIFLDNINPFTMIMHRPTMTASIQKAILNLDHIPKGMEALMFSIYSAAVVSMQDREVEDTFGESRRSLITRYQTATKVALARAKFMGSSDILVLQAFVLHLLAMRETYDGRTLWTLSGVAIRIGEGMGLHRDGTFLGLPPFKTEMRRRLWFQITTLDYRSAELSGTNKIKAFDFQHINTKVPLNVNDEDLWPDMTELPAPQEKPTDMVLCSLRYEFATFWGDKRRKNEVAGTIWDNYKATTSMEQQDAAVDELEQRLEEKHVRYFDPSIPTQFMASIVARTATNSMRFMAHHPRRWSSDDEIPESEKKLLWKLCTRILECYVMCITSSTLKRFVWHTSFYFQWQALIYMLDMLSIDPLRPGADEAWKHIGEIYAVHPHFVTDTKKAIHVAVGNLCLKAYNARQQAFEREGRYLPPRPPHYIELLRQQREAAQTKEADRKARLKAQSQSPSVPNAAVSSDIVNMFGFEASPGAFSQPQQPQQQPLTQQQSQQQPRYQQLPLPPFQTSKRQPPVQMQSHQQPAPFWFNSFNSMAEPSFNGDMDWMMVQEPAMDETVQMNWNQWDYLLQEGGGGMVGFGDSRTTI